MKSIKKELIILGITFGMMIIFSNTNIANADNLTREITINYNEEIDSKKLEDIKTTRFKALLTPRITVQATPTQEDVSKYYYNQLKNDVSKNTYNALANQLSNKVIVDINSMEYDIEEETEEEYIKCFQTNLYPYVLDGYEAYIMDGGNNYWWTAEGISFGEMKIESSNNKVIFKTVEIISDAEEWANHDNFNAKLKEVCNSFNGESVYEIVRDINYYICNNVEYTILDDTDIEQTAYGALMMNKAVCEGQAQLFNLMCREKGILSLNIYGFTSESNVTTAHAWNYVYEPTNKQWYAVDVTWNNQYKDPKYLMLGSETKVDGIKFSKNHLAGFKQYEDQTYTPSTPEFATDRYIEPINVDGEYIYNIQPNTEYNNFVKEFSSDIEFIVKENDTEITGTEKIKTGQTLIFGNINYVLAVKGDVTGDGKADFRDILAINKHIRNISDKSVLTNELYKAANTDNNQTVDIHDILQINKYRLRKITEL